MWFFHNIRFSNPIILKFCRKQGSIIALLPAKFQNDLITEK